MYRLLLLLLLLVFAVSSSPSVDSFQSREIQVCETQLRFFKKVCTQSKHPIGLSHFSEDMTRTDDKRKKRKRKREEICPCFRKACRRKFDNKEPSSYSTVYRHRTGGLTDFVSLSSDESSNSDAEADVVGAEEDVEVDVVGAEEDVEVDVEVHAEVDRDLEVKSVDAVLEGGETDGDETDGDETDEEEAERQEQQAQLALESIDKALHIRNYARELLALVG